jgi:hypothetical protein
MTTRPTIFTDGAPTPPVTSLVASKSFSRSVDATKAHDMTLAGGASFNGGIFLAAVVVDRALKGSMVGEWMNKSLGREVREKDVLRDFKGREPLFLFRILPFHNMNDALSMGRMQREKTESKRVQGQAGWPRSVAGWPHFAPRNSRIFPKIPLKLLNSLLPLILEIWKENFEKGKS